MEWTVVTVLVILAGLFATVGAPVIRLITSLTKLTSEVTYLRVSMSETSTRNDESHKAICGQIENHGDTIQDHETRITVLEKHKEVD